jgi:hypothetical protein
VADGERGGNFTDQGSPEWDGWDADYYYDNNNSSSRNVQYEQG